MRRALCAVALLGLAGCAPLGAGLSCLLPAQRPMVVAELFFGRDIPGRGPLTDREWSSFAAAVIAKEFPDGFTVVDGEGQWTDPQTHAPAHEGTKVLIAASPRVDDLPGRIERITDAYRSLFHQQSVGVVTYSACGKF
jgi:hypothetical protein